MSYHLRNAFCGSLTWFQSWLRRRSRAAGRSAADPGEQRKSVSHLARSLSHLPASSDSAGGRRASTKHTGTGGRVGSLGREGAQSVASQLRCASGERRIYYAPPDSPAVGSGRLQRKAGLHTRKPGAGQQDGGLPADLTNHPGQRDSACKKPVLRGVAPSNGRG